jgi:hypothetical protein
MEASKHPYFKTRLWKTRGHVNMYIYNNLRTGKACHIETKTPWRRETEYFGKLRHGNFSIEAFIYLPKIRRKAE